MKAPEPSNFFILGCLWNGCALFLLPFVLLLGCAAFFDVSDISNTGEILSLLFLCLILPSFLGMLINTFVKVRKEIHYFAKEKIVLHLSQKLDIIRKHSTMLTYRGWFFLATSCFFILLTTIFSWASLGTLTVFFLLTLYFTIGLSSIVGIFQSRNNSQMRNKSQIVRRFIPAVLLTGEEAKEVIECQDIYVPMGYNLLMEEVSLPMDTITRYAIGTQASKKCTLEGTFPTTPRGVHSMGPMNIWYQDILGLTKITLPAFAQATLKCLPRFQNIVIIESPNASSTTTSILTKPKQNPTEDYFLCKEYKDGDDTRRIHWGLSVRSGSIQVRIPETKEDSTDSVLLVLDNYLPIDRRMLNPRYIENILTQLVELWLSLANQLHREGKTVQIAGLVDGNIDQLKYVCIDCAKTDQIVWQDLGARVSWQHTFDVDDIMKDHIDGKHLIVVSSRFFAPPKLPSFVTTTWIYVHPLQSITIPTATFFQHLIGSKNVSFIDKIKACLFLPNDIGSEKNTVQRQLSLLKEELDRYTSLRYFSKHISKHANHIPNILSSQASTVFCFEERAGLLVLVEYDRSQA